MAVNFPDSPTNGDTHAVGNLTYVYNSTTDVWEPSQAVTTATIQISDTPPATAIQGELWHNSSDMKLYVYYNDGTSSQWVVASPQIAGPAGPTGPSSNLTAVAEDILPDADSSRNLGSPTKKWKGLYLSSSTIFLGDSGTISAGAGGAISLPSIKIGSGTNTIKLEASSDGKLKTRAVVGGVEQDEEDIGAGATVTQYDSSGLFPTSGNTLGSMAMSKDKKGLYIWDSAEWDRIQLDGNVAPRFVTSPPATLEMTTASDSSSFTASAIDELGFPITYDWDAFSGSTIYNSSNLPPQTTSITQTSAGAFRFVHDSASVTPAGTFNFRTKVSDGAATNVALTAVTLQFSPLTRNSAYKWTYSEDVTRASDLYTDLAAADFTSVMTADNTGGGNQSQKYAYGAYIKFNMLVGPSSTPKTVIGFVNRNSGNNNWSLSPFDYGGAPNEDGNYRNFKFINSNADNSTISDWSNTSNGSGRLIHLVNEDDNDGSFMRADGAAIIHQGQVAFDNAQPVWVYQPNTVYTTNASDTTAHAGSTSVLTQAANWPGSGAAIGMYPWLQQVKASTSAPWAGISSYDVTNRQSSYSGYTGAASTARFAVVSFMGIGGEVVFEYFGGQVAYYVSVILPNGYVHRFSRQTISSPSNIASVFDGQNMASTAITSVNDGFSEASMHRSEANANAITFNVNWTNGTLENVTNITLSQVPKHDTEEDIYGDPIHLVLGCPWFHRHKATSPSGSYYLHSWADGIPLATHENWKSINNYGRFMGQTDYTYYKQSSGRIDYNTGGSGLGGNQAGLDLFAMIGPQNYLYLGDWGHDAEGVFGQNGANDTQFTFSRSNIRLIPSNWY
tara:strand:- start:294 stop:2819 length:2526 start_codon:yes stop_codon:yes gene_type:complete